MNNLLISLLRELSVKYTSSFASKLYNEHPYRDSFYGLSKMLSEYKIENVGLRVNDKDQLTEYTPPFIAQHGHDFVMVKRIENNKITYFQDGQIITTSVDEFKRWWKGVLLLAESDENSIEPNYKKNSIESLVRRFLTALLGMGFIVSMIIGILQNNQYYSFHFWGLLLFSLLGAYISFLLVKKDLNVSDRYGDKICSLFKKADCNTVLETKAAKLAGIFSWSEIGLSYFISNMLILVFFPFLYFYLAVISLCALPYTVWSVWYQFKVVKIWCPLCMITQIILWIIFLINLSSGTIFSTPVYAFSDFLLIGIVYGVPFAGIALLLLLIKKVRELPVITQQLNYLKNKKEVFNALLEKSIRYDVQEEDSQIFFGDPQAKMQITILTNPHCEPCANMHNRVKNILENTNYKCGIRYIFSSFNADLEESNKSLISIYLSDKENAAFIYDEWFKKKRYEREQFYAKYPITPKLKSEVEEEFKRHNSWRERAKLSATPTVLINGFLLPREYVIEDMKFMTDLTY